MPVRNSKPYSSPKRTTKKVNTRRKTKEMPDVTTRIRIDDIRLNDSDSLDTSFLEGRAEKQVKRNTRKVKDRILKDDSKKIKKVNLIKKILVCIIIVLVVILGIVLVVDFVKKNATSKKDDNKAVLVKEKKDDKVIVDSNYIFVGDFYTEKLDFEEYELDYHYVNNSDSKLTTGKALEDVNEYIIKYNPSVVFVELGINDLNSDISTDEIVENIDSLIDSIKTYRPYAKICIESLYPINKDVSKYDDSILDGKITNKSIKKVNNRLEKLCKEKEVTYIDMFEVLEDEDGLLDEEYTTNGIYLNEDGYKQVLKYIKKEIGE